MSVIKRTLSRQEQIARATDPIFVLIAEETRLRNLGIDFRNRADVAQYGVNSVDDRPRLYAEAERYESAAADFYDRIVTTPATTVAGILAKLEFADDDPRLVNSVIGDLLRLTAKGGEGAAMTKRKKEGDDLGRTSNV
jgi:hypothetical protein